MQLLIQNMRMLKSHTMDHRVKTILMMKATKDVERLEDLE